MKFLYLVLGFLALFISGCATQERVKVYGDQVFAGPPALVKPVAFIEINSIDGGKFSIHPSSGMTTEFELELPPGLHYFKVAYFDGVLKSAALSVKPVLASGRKYIIKPIVSGRSWRPAVVDVTDKPECWTISVGTSLFGTPLGPTGCDGPEISH